MNSKQQSSISSSIQLPEFLQKQIVDLSKELSDLKSHIIRVKGQIQSKEYESRMNILSSKELAVLQPETKCYVGIGKMFLINQLSHVLQNLECSAKSASQEISSLSKLLSQFEGKFAEKENNLAELLKNNNLTIKE